MQIELTAADADCRRAAEEYLDALRAAGLPIAWQAMADLGEGLCVEWATPPSDPSDEWEDDVPDAPGQDDRGLDRLVEHYLPTVRLLLGDLETARSWLAGRSPRKRKPR